jgi:hypothetical protein
LKENESDTQDLRRRGRIIERERSERGGVSEKYGNVLYHSICMHSVETKCNIYNRFSILNVLEFSPTHMALTLKLKRIALVIMTTPKDTKMHRLIYWFPYLNFPLKDYFSVPFLQQKHVSNQ